MPSSSPLLRQSLDQQHPAPPPPRPRPHPLISLAADPDPGDADNYSSSDSSASSAASVTTVRPSSREQAAGPAHWTQFFSEELFLEEDLRGGEDGAVNAKARYHVYVSPPRDVRKGPLFVCHHGAGASGLSFALFAKEVRVLMPEAGVVSLEARGHGSVVMDLEGNEIVDFSLATLATDALTMLLATQTALAWPSLPPLVLVGHSLGGAVVTALATSHWKAFGQSLIGYAVLDVVEGSAMEALGFMKSYLASRPSKFSSPQEAIDWHVRTRTIRLRESAEVSTPSLLTQLPSGEYTWRTDLTSTTAYWWDWFTGMSSRFLTGRGAKLLVLAGTDRLDKELMIGQMQGKFQLTVLPEAGHFVQEDVPARTAQLMVEFFKRNDRSAMVLPPKVADLLAQGKKV